VDGQGEDVAARCTRLEERQRSIQESVNRNERNIAEAFLRMEKYREERVEQLEKLNETLTELRTRIIGTAIALGIIIVIANLVGTAIAIYAAVAK
jgi:hypothetical protein